MQAMFEVSSSAGSAFVSCRGVLDCLVSNVHGLLVEAHERGSDTIIGRRYLHSNLDFHAMIWVWSASCPRLNELSML